MTTVPQSGDFYPDHGLERMVAYHERQDRRYAQVARETSERHGKPVLPCTELAVTERLSIIRGWRLRTRA